MPGHVGRSKHHIGLNETTIPHNVTEMDYGRQAEEELTRPALRNIGMAKLSFNHSAISQNMKEPGNGMY